MLRLLTALLALAALPAGAIDEDDLLPVDQAFAISASDLGDGRIRVRWSIAEGYYMYRGRISFNNLSDDVRLGEAQLPPGKKKVDEFFGEVETYRDQVDVLIPVLSGDFNQLELEARSQGCADLGVCYPPHRQRVTIEATSTEAPLNRRSSGLPLSGSLAPDAGPNFGQSGGLEIDAGPLPEDEAFRFEAIAISSSELLARWTIAPGYYQYRDQIAFETDADSPMRLREPTLPPGEQKVDDHFGDVEVFRGQVEIALPISRLSAEASSARLTGHYRGCKDESICYPPIQRSLTVDLPAHDGALGQASAALASGATEVIDNPPEAGRIEAPQGAVAAPGAALPVPEQDRLAQALGEDSLWTILSFFGFGLLLAFTPCVFPMIPILSGIIAGQGSSLSTARAFVLSLVYVLAMAATYTIAGVIAGYWGYNLQAAFQNAWVLGSFSLIFVLLALSMFGFYELQLPSALQSRLNALSNRQQGGTLIGVAIMGFLSALIVGPCVAPPLAAALIYIGQTGDPLLGGSALFALSMGMGAPLLVIGTSAGKLLPRAGGWMDAIKAVFGVALLALALWMLERIAPPALIMLGWGLLLTASAVYLGALERLPDGASGWRRLWKSFGVALLILGVLEFVGAAAGGRDWVQPLKGVSGGSGQTVGAGPRIAVQTIKSVDDLEQRLSADTRPALLDFYADWCVDCKRMDKYSFPDPAVQAALADGIMLKADVTANDAIDQALLKKFGIIGPPAILFFDSKGREMPAYRVIGYQDPETFAEHVRQAFAAGGAGS